MKIPVNDAHVVGILDSLLGVDITLISLGTFQKILAAKNLTFHIDAPPTYSPFEGRWIENRWRAVVWDHTKSQNETCPSRDYGYDEDGYETALAKAVVEYLTSRRGMRLPPEYRASR